MAPDGAADDATNERRVPIDHAAVVDGFRELDGFTHYLAFRVSCGACPTVVTVTPNMQQHLLEVARIPFKMLRRGAVRCAPCAATRRRYKWLKRHDRWREVSGGQQELAQLEAAERAARTHGGSEATVQDWPYDRA
jgi:hypothetical protein